ncbi:MAG: hypothetical protein IPI43_28370 [Sandaracinaceae bacterium]|nr:hypothetical protein [Sandaracinaceae bacterium]
MHRFAITVTLLSAALIIGCDGAGPDLAPGADADVMVPSPDGGVSPDAGAREDQGAGPVALGSPPIDLGADLGDITDTAVPTTTA